MAKLKLILWLSMPLLATALVYANLDGPPPGHTGAPDEPTCAMVGCHDMPSNRVGALYLDLSGQMGSDTIDYVVRLTDLGIGPAGNDWGFQLTALDSAGQAFGTILVTDSMRTRLTQGPDGKSYLSQTAEGVPGDNTCANCTHWPFTWVRPAGATVQDSAYLYVAGVIANGDASPGGDVVVILVSIQRSYYCVVPVPGDVNRSGQVSSADIISLIGYIFKGGQSPDPCEAAGDANCDLKITTGDIVALVNYVFKSGPQPCDVCPLILDGAWDC